MKAGSANGLGPKDYEIKALVTNPEFVEYTRKLREKWQIPAEGFQSNWDQNKWRETHDSKSAELQKDIKELRKNFRLGLRWQTALLFYLTTNNPLTLRAQSPWRIRFTYEGTISDHSNVDDISIETDGETTQEELIDAHRTVKHLDKKPKKQLVLNTDRDNMVLSMYDTGNSHLQIAAWLNDHYPGSFNTDHVRKIIKRTQDRQKKGRASSD